MLSVEIDPSFYSDGDRDLGYRERVILLHCDALKNKNQIEPQVFEAISTLRERTGCNARQAGVESALRRGDAGDLQFSAVGCAFRADGGDRAVGDRRAV